jgi:FkbM family methyltransferase
MIPTSIKTSFQAFWKSFRFNLSANDSVLFTAYYQYFYSPKKGSLSDFLSQYSASKKGDFTVVQIGANDGITNDPIHKFIKRDRWKGVLLEPQPDVYREFLSKIYQKNPEIHPICAAIGTEDGSQKLYKIGFSSMRWATGLASFSLEKIHSLFHDGIVEKNCKRFGIEIPKDPEKQISSEIVDVISPKTLFEKYQISHVDLLQIDAEGYDLEVINMFDIATTKPDAIIFENENLDSNALESCYNFLRNEGYQLRKFGRDTLALTSKIKLFEDLFKNQI